MKFDVMAYGEGVLDTKGNDACAPTLYGPDKGPIAGECQRSDETEYGSAKMKSSANHFAFQANPKGAAYTLVPAQAGCRTN